MKSGIMFEQGEIVIVPFPFSDLSATRKRPVLILSKNKNNLVYDDIVTCGITSNLKDSFNSVLFDNSDLDKGAIPVKSRIKVDKLFTLDKSIILKKIAKLNKVAFEKVKEVFKELI